MANPLSDAFYWWTTGKSASQLEREMAASDKRLQELNQDALSRGLYDADTFEAAETNRLNGIVDPTFEIKAAAVEGAKEGLAEMQDAVKTGAATLVKVPLGFIPWWVWPLAALAVFGYLGGFSHLKGVLAKR